MAGHDLEYMLNTKKKDLNAFKWRLKTKLFEYCYK